MESPDRLDILRGAVIIQKERTLQACIRLGAAAQKRGDVAQAARYVHMAASIVMSVLKQEKAIAKEKTDPH